MNPLDIVQHGADVLGNDAEFMAQYRALQGIAMKVKFVQLGLSSRTSFVYTGDQIKQVEAMLACGFISTNPNDSASVREPVSCAEHGVAFTLTLTKEDYMSKNYIQTKTFVGGADFTSMSDDAVFSAISSMEAQIKSLSSLEHAPQATKDKIAQLQANIEGLVKLADERTAAGKPSTTAA